MHAQAISRINRVLSIWLVILGVGVLLVIVLPPAIGLELTPVLDDHPAAVLKAGDLAITEPHNIRELSPGYTVLLPKSDDSESVLAGRITGVQLGQQSEEAAILTELGAAVDSSPWQPAEEEIVDRVIGYVPGVGFLWDELTSPIGTAVLVTAFLLPAAFLLAGLLISIREKRSVQKLAGSSQLAYEQSYDFRAAYKYNR